MWVRGGVALFFFKTPCLLFFVLYFDLSQEIVILERIITRKYLEQIMVFFVHSSKNLDTGFEGR